MDVQYVNPVIESVISTFAAMARMKVDSGAPGIKKNAFAKGEISGLISLIGPRVCMSVGLSFPETLMRHIGECMLPPGADTQRGILMDLAGELVNIVAGGAKQRLALKNYTFTLSLPIIIYGVEHIMTHRCKGLTIALPMTLPNGGFHAEICYGEWVRN